MTLSIPAAGSPSAKLRPPPSGLLKSTPVYSVVVLAETREIRLKPNSVHEKENRTITISTVAETAQRFRL